MPPLKGAVEKARPYVGKIERGELEPRQMHPAGPAAPAPPIEAGPRLSPFLCCPLPGIAVAPDSLVQFYRQGIPQMRILGSKPLTSS
jgi:hypothetical protein